MNFLQINILYFYKTNPVTLFLTFFVKKPLYVKFDTYFAIKEEK